jgi:multicomponent Na+:H+ antiporter subunit E
VLQRDEENNFTSKVVAVFKFILVFFKELFVANLILARLAFQGQPRLQPHVLAVPLQLKTDIAISLLSATITLLPGTIAMGVSEDRSELYAHAMGAELEAAKDSIVRIETLILGFMR